MEPINRFNSDVERGKYVSFAVKYILANGEDIQKSIDGLFDEERKRWISRKLRGSEHPDIEWLKLSSSNEVLREAVWNVFRYRAINLKVCCDAYAADLGMGCKDFYNTIATALPSSKVNLPNGSECSLFDTLKLVRDQLAHANDPKHRSDRERLGISDVRSFLLTKVRFFDDGLDKRLASYDLCSQNIQGELYLHSGVDYENGSFSFYEILEQEICNAINAYDAIRSGTFNDEAECIEKGFWRPVSFVK
jgi:hypothetical protein